MHDTHPFGPAIHVYTRAQAIADGNLIDVSLTAAEVGFRYPVALTSAAWADCVAWSDADNHRQTLQDEPGRLLDVLWLAKLAAKKGRGQSLTFDLRRVPRDGHSVYSHKARLRLVIGPGDAGEPVLTIMLPDED
ncbi:DUF6573 family protein [Paraburkholderia dinghuensis]|uniref:Uncharacterized protein n=1 Tax=Paraburkholderia dinghuensis TaxID=2305225 RepID=A0A3N6MFU5_9BURK|nr:DUF6573 family protein [Paraburkholderia dinghuensis]RQG99834.1 hypothetical protein D1Y85_26035 [Paraburkholderia dinghuensis]